MSTTVLDQKVLAIHQLRVNVNSLAAEAKIIRRETARAGVLYRDALARHRKGRLREEARYAQLALGYIRGRSYRTIERNAKSPPAASRLAEKLKRYSVSAKDLTDWLN